jgi:hypothetical protein
MMTQMQEIMMTNLGCIAAIPIPIPIPITITITMVTLATSNRAAAPQRSRWRSHWRTHQKPKFES